MWLAVHAEGKPTRTERIADWLVHKTLITVKLPLLHLDAGLRCRTVGSIRNPISSREAIWRVSR